MNKEGIESVVLVENDVLEKMITYVHHAEIIKDIDTKAELIEKNIEFLREVGRKAEKGNKRIGTIGHLLFWGLLRELPVDASFEKGVEISLRIKPHE